jgi:NitT/TauT family transport system ATP-binding protein
MRLRGRRDHRRGTDVVDGPLLCVDGVSVRFSDNEVPSSVDLRVSAGEFVTLLGPSGCGKSTLLNVTAGTVRPHTGAVRFAGHMVTSINRGVGYVTQEDTMLPWLSLAANVGLPLRMRGVERSVIRAKVDR